MKERAVQILLAIAVLTLPANHAVALMITAIAFCSVVSSLPSGAMSLLAIGNLCALGGGLVRDFIFSGGNYACLSDPLYIPAALVGALIGLLARRLKLQFDSANIDNACSLAFAAIGFQTASRLGLGDSGGLVLIVCYLTAYGGGLVTLLWSKEPLREIERKLATQVTMLFAAIGVNTVSLPFDAVKLIFLIALAVPRAQQTARSIGDNQEQSPTKEDDSEEGR